MRPKPDGQPFAADDAPEAAAQRHLFFAERAASRDPAERYSGIADRLCESGRLGRKTGKGWYAYDERRGRRPDPQIHALIEAGAAAKGIVRRPFADAEIVEHVLVTMVNEAALLVAEGVARHPADVDVVFVHGYGFPRHEGGPLFRASRRSPEFLARAQDILAATDGPTFRRGDISALLAGLNLPA
jgi:3-hydroxyacyl-CoA dehydrogenase